MKSRRELLRMLSVAGAGSVVSSCSSLRPPFLGQQDEKASDAEMLALLFEESDGDFAQNKGLIIRGNDKQCAQLEGADFHWWENPNSPLAQPDWPVYQEGIDYYHLREFGYVGARFTLDDATLQFLSDRNGFLLSQGKPKTLFGLRGCMIPGGHDTGWGVEHELQLAFPDHLNFRCVLGVWDRDEKRVRLFTGSTVPHGSYMWSQVRCVSDCNMMPTGLYYYEVGVHPQRNPQASCSAQVGAFILKGARFEDANQDATFANNILVIRTLNDLKYSPQYESEYWDIINPGDHIHSAVFDNDTKGAKQARGRVEFSSAGCQVVKGDYEINVEDCNNTTKVFLKTPRGPWSEFRAAAGLQRDPELKENRPYSSTDDGTGFQYMLLTGDEAALASSARDHFQDSYHRVRFGSQGEATAQLQASLGLDPDGKAGAETIAKLIERRKERKEFESPVWIHQSGDNAQT